MNTKHMTIALLLIAATIISCGTQNNPIAPQTSQPSAIKPTTVESIPVPQDLTQRLNLTAAQQENLLELTRAFSSDFQAAQDDASDQQDLMDEFENDFLNLFSTDQQAQYQSQKNEILPVLETLVGGNV